MVADDCRGVEVMLCGVNVGASDIGLGGGCQVACAGLDRCGIVAGCNKNAGTGTQLGFNGCNWLTAESLHMQHAGPNARRAGVGLLHVASETALSTGGGRCVGGVSGGYYWATGGMWRV